MAARDIMPFSSVHGGGISRNLAFKIENNGTTVTATHRIGEVVLLDVADGDIDELAAGSAALDKDIHYLALEDAVANIRRIGDARYGNTPSPSYPCTVAVFDPECEYITRNACNNADINIGPAGTGAMTSVVVGQACGVRVFAGGTHAIDINVGGARITRIIDSLGRDTYISGATPWAIVFRPD